MYKDRVATYFHEGNGRGAFLLVGMPRSATTWLAKIVDSHPDVLYRHEPDIQLPADNLPWFSPAAERETLRSLAREYLKKLVALRTLRTGGPLPINAKSYRSAIGHAFRTGLIIGLRGMEIVVGSRRWPSRMSLPDFIAEGYQGDIRVLVKSVNAIGHARLFAEAWPECKIATIVRHPCGYVESQLRGATLGKMSGLTLLEEFMGSPRAEKLGLKIDEPSSLSIIEQLAWGWAFLNQSMLDELSGLTHVKTIMYGDLTANPTGIARDLFAFLGLPWASQTEEFIKKSTISQRRERYFGLRKDPLQANNRWRRALSSEDQQRILSIARRVAIGRACAELSDP